LQENFTNGYPGHEKAYRAAMLKVLGQEKYDYFWSKFYEYCQRIFRPPSSSGTDVLVYDAPDAKWFASLGLNLQRLAINYRHLNDDLDPEVMKESGFKLIDRVVELVSRLVETLLRGECGRGHLHHPRPACRAGRAKLRLA
jgi:hypothetical protein